MHAWEQIQKTVDYIEENISEDIRIESLAEMAALSPFYYQRLFARLVKKPVNEYIKLRRMARATEILLQKDKRIIDVALDLGFSSHEQFSRNFKEVFGVTPDNYRKSPTTFSKMTKPELLLNYTLVEENVPLVTDGIVLEISRKRLESTEYFVGLVCKQPISYIEGYGIESGVDLLYALWDRFHNNKESIKALLPNSDEIGVVYPCIDEGYFNYFAGGQAKYDIVVEGYENWKLAQGEYIVCTVEAENFECLVMDVLHKATQYLFDIWLPNHKIEVDAFSVGRFESHSPSTTKMEIWVLPITQSNL